MDIKKVGVKIISIICVAILLVSCNTKTKEMQRKDNKKLQANNASQMKQSEYDPDVTFDEMSYDDAVLEGMEGKMWSFIEAAKKAKSIEELKEIDRDYMKLNDEVNTAQTLATVWSNLNMNDEKAEAEFEKCSHISAIFLSLSAQYYRSIWEGEWKAWYIETLSKGELEQIEMMMKTASNEVTELQEKRAGLVFEYNRKMHEITTEHEGAQLSFNEIDLLENQQIKHELLDQLNRENLHEFTALIKQIVEIDKQIAKTMGYRSVEEMYYQSYQREYGYQETKKVGELLKKHFLPLMEQGKEWKAPCMDREEAMEKMPQFLGEIDAKFVDVWEKMQKNNLCSISDDSQKLSFQNYVRHIPNYNTPYLYIYWDAGMLSTIAHEFGHFLDYALLGTSHSKGPDEAELYAQMMEGLLLQKYELFYGEDATNSRDHELYYLFLYDLLDKLSQGEFLHQLYSLPNEELTSENITRLYSAIKKEYKLIPDDVQDDMWYRTIFLDYPFYDLSYVPGKLMALQLWDISVEEYDKAVEVFKNMFYSEECLSANELAQKNGLKEFGSEESIKKIASRLAENFSDD